MTNAKIIEATLEWIEDNLREELGVAEVAARSGYSVHHFSRLFTALVGCGPKDYLLDRKLSEAGLELARGRRRVIDVALDFGFRDPETFSRAFSRRFGLAPSAARRGAGFAFRPSALAELRRSLSTLPEPPEATELGPLKLAGWSLSVGEATEEVGRLWARFMGRAGGIRGRAEPLRTAQLATWTEGASGERIDILVAAVMDNLEGLDLDLVGRAVPACSYLVFEHRGSAARIPESYRAIYGELLPAMEARPGLPFSLELYDPGRSDPYAEDYRYRILVPLALVDAAAGEAGGGAGSPAAGFLGVGPGGAA